jgi:hypothetical protein
LTAVSDGGERPCNHAKRNYARARYNRPVQGRAAFNELAVKMRDIKRRYFFKPPLSDAGIISLGLKPGGAAHTAGSIPTAQVTIETYFVGRRELGIKIVYVMGDSSETANNGYRIWYRVPPATEVPPGTTEELRESFYTKRKKDLLEFPFEDSGKTAYFAVQVENEDKKGPWCPVVSALIP